MMARLASVPNSLGQVVYQGKIWNEAQIETHNWQRGMYIVKIGNVSKKLIVQ